MSTSADRSVNLRRIASIILCVIFGIIWGCGSRSDPPHEPIIKSSPPLTAAYGIPYSYVINAAGNPSPSLSVSGLPMWLNFDPETRILCGTPAVENGGLTETIIVIATNGINPDASQSFVIAVSDPIAPEIISVPPLTTMVGDTYLYEIQATGNPTPSLVVTGLPSWLKYNSKTKTLSGRTTVKDMGLAPTLTIVATNGVSPDATQQLQIAVQREPVIASIAPTLATVDIPYSYIIQATGYPVPTLSVTGLPAWLTYNPATRTLFGTPLMYDIGNSETIVITADNGIEPIAVEMFNITVSTWALTGSYAVVDLEHNTVTNLSGAPPDLLSNITYRTTRLVLKRITAGAFIMGDRTGEGQYWERPAHIVILSDDFYIGVFEVTQRQWYEVKGTWPSYHTTPSLTDKHALPVESVSWNDIKSGSGFVETLSSETDLFFDLPTEAQWEYACRAGTSLNYSYGNSPDGSYMWYSENNIPWKTKEVGTRLPNPWGLYDMHGNVWEWCRDWFSASFENTPSYYQSCYDLGYIIDPTGPETGYNRALRGGVWVSLNDDCRSSCRSRNDPNIRRINLGFRVVAVRQKD